MKKYLTIEGRREGYALSQLDSTMTMTVGELIEYLEDLDEDMPVVLNNDNGYTYGTITWTSFEEEEDEDEDEEEEEE